MKKEDNGKVLPYLKDVFLQLNEMASLKAKTSELLKHHLAKGMNNEEILRRILRAVLPKKYGIGKGKIISPTGVMSRQCDIIIFDALNCPCLFIDDNLNQVLPIEGIYAVIEVKTNLTKHELNDAFALVHSVKKLVTSPKDMSRNKLINIIPPLAYVVGYDDKRSLKTLYANYVSINKQYNPSYSSLSYSKKSPGHLQHTHEHFLVEDVLVMNKGSVYYMYDGFPVMHPSGSDSLGILITNLVLNLGETKLETPDLLDYYGYVTVEYDAFTKTRNRFVEINKARAARFPTLFDKEGRRIIKTAD